MSRYKQKLIRYKTRLFSHKIQQISKNVSIISQMCLKKKYIYYENNLDDTTFIRLDYYRLTRLTLLFPNTTISTLNTSNKQ